MQVRLNPHVEKLVVADVRKLNASRKAHRRISPTERVNEIVVEALSKSKYQETDR